MIIAGIDVGYRNIDKYYIFKGVIMYYIYDGDKLVDKRIEISKKEAYLDSMYDVDRYRVELERELADRAIADYILIDGHLDSRFFSIRNRINRFWIPKRVETQEIYIDSDIIVRTFGKEGFRYRIETFPDNRDSLESLIKLLNTSTIIYPFILAEADRFSIVKDREIPFNLKLLVLTGKVHRRLLRR